MSSQEVDDYIEARPESQRSALELIRAAARAAAPEADEVITYKMPGFKLDGRFLISYDAYKNHFSLFPASDGVVNTLGDEVAPYVAGRGTLRFPYDEPPSDDLLRRIVKARVVEESARSR